MSVSGCISAAADMQFVHCYEELEYEGTLCELIRSHSARTVPKAGISLVAIQHPFSTIYLIDQIG